MDITRATSKLTTVQASNAVISFFGIAYFARELGPEQMGVYFLFHSLMAVLTIPADFGIRNAVEKRISEDKAPETFLTTGTLIKLVPLSITAAGILLLSDTINGYIGADLADLLVIALALEEYSSFAVNVLKGELHVGRTAIIRLLKQVTWVIVGTILVIYGLKARALVYAFISGNMTMMLVGMYRWNTSFGRPSLIRVSSLWQFSRYSVVTSIGAFVHNWLDVLVLGFFLGQSAVGVYEIAWRVATSLLLVTRSFAETIIPQVSTWSTNGNISKIESFLPTGLLLSLVFVLPGLFGTVLLSEQILGLVFGQEYVPASLALIILAGGMCIETIHIVLGRTLAGMNRVDIGARISVVMVLLNVLLNVILIPTIGIPGAAIATAISFSIGTLILSYRLTDLLTVRVPARETAYLLAAALGMGGAVYVARRQLVIDSLAELFGVVAFGGIVYFALIYAIVPLRTHLLTGLRELS